jgi:hypothetical protein
MHPLVSTIEILPSLVSQRFFNIHIQSLQRDLSSKNGSIFGMHSRDAMKEQSSVLDEKFNIILIALCWYSLLPESRIFEIEVSAPEAAMLALLDH